MGGYGSGRGPARYRTVEGCHALDVRRLRRDGYLRPGSVVITMWSDGRTGEILSWIYPATYSDKVALSYRHRRTGEEWQDVEEPVQITWTPYNCGGERPWFLCPGIVNGVRGQRRLANLDGPRDYYPLALLLRDGPQEPVIEKGEGGDWGGRTVGRQVPVIGRVDRRMEKAQSIRIRHGGSVSLLEPLP